MRTGNFRGIAFVECCWRWARWEAGEVCCEECQGSRGERGWWRFCKVVKRVGMGGWGCLRGRRDIVYGKGDEGMLIVVL